MSDAYRIWRGLDDLTDAQILDLHRELSRRAALIYGPMYREKQETNYRNSPASGGRAWQRHRKASRGVGV